MEARQDTLTLRIDGMTCDHCRVSVTEEISEVDGVDSVDVDLAGGRAVVRGIDLDRAAIIAAVVEAGYDATPVPRTGR